MTINVKINSVNFIYCVIYIFDCNYYGDIMEIKNLTLILSLFLILIVALGSVSADEVLDEKLSEDSGVSGSTGGSGGADDPVSVDSQSNVDDSDDTDDGTDDDSDDTDDGTDDDSDDDASDSETEGGSDDAPLAISSSSSMDDASGANDGSAGDSSIHTNLSDQVAGHPLLMLVLSLFALFIVPFSKR